MGHSTTPRQRALFAIFLLALFPAWNSLQPKLDEDTWWHLAVGKYVIEHGAVPTEDPFSRIGQEEHIPWVAYSWLHEIALYEAYQVGGLGAIIAFRQALDALTFLTLAWFVLRRSGDRLLPLLIFTLVTLCLVPMMLERPWHYTIILTTLCLHTACEMRAGKSARQFWWLVPCFALWANLHIQFVLGFGVLGLGILATGIEQRRADNNAWPWRGWIVLLVVCVLATLVNPYHIRLYQVVWEYASQTGAMRLVSELSPPGIRLFWNWALFTLLAWAGWKCLVQRLPLFETAFFIVGAIFSLRMQRDIWFGAVIAALVLTAKSQAAAMPRRRILEMAGAILAASLLARLVWPIANGSHNPEVKNREEFPAEAVEFIRESRPPGPLYNHFNWGGYLIWTLPEYPVSLDGRTNLYGEERLLRAFNTWNGEEGWDRDSDLLAAGVILVPASKKLQTELLERLRKSPDRWRVVYEDEVAVVFVW
jgi:hypothetical protein